MTPKYCWRSKRKRKRTNGKSLGEPLAEEKSPACKPQLEEVANSSRDSEGWWGNIL